MLENRKFHSQVRNLAFVGMMAIGLVVQNLSANEGGLKLVDLEGSPVHLDSYIGKGQWLLVMIWATDCVVCKAEKPKISAFHDRHKNDMARVIGIALDGLENKSDIDDYLKKNKTTFPTFTGDFSEISRKYAIYTGEPLRGTPTYLLYTPAGELVGNNPGPLSEGSLERFIEKYNAL